MFIQSEAAFIQLSAWSLAIDAHLLSNQECLSIFSALPSSSKIREEAFAEREKLLPALLQSASLRQNPLRKEQSLLCFLQGKFREQSFLYRCQQAYEKGMRALCWIDAFYPLLLRQSEAAPAILFVLSQALLRSGKALWNQYASACITLIGSRKATDYGERTVKQVARQAAEAGFIIVSGMAYGIDHLGQRAALDAGGCSFAVLAGAADDIYPAQNRDLHEELVEKAAVFSEHAAGVRAIRSFFPARNRIMSALSTVCVVIESTQRSGTLITVEQALEQGRDVWAVPGNIHSPNSKGCNRLIQEGASPLIDIEDFITCMRSSRKHLLPKPTDRSAARPLAVDGESRRSNDWIGWQEAEFGRRAEISRQICQVLKQRSQAMPEQLAAALNLEEREVFACLAILEMRGLLRYREGSYALTSREESYIHDNA